MFPRKQRRKVEQECGGVGVGRTLNGYRINPQAKCQANRRITAKLAAKMFLKI